MPLSGGRPEMQLRCLLYDIYTAEPFKKITRKNSQESSFLFSMTCVSAAAGRVPE